MSKMDAIKVSVEDNTSNEAKKSVKRKRDAKKEVVKKTEVKNQTKPKSKSKSGKKGFFSHFFVFTITAAIVGGGIYYWQNGVVEESIGKLRSDARNTRINLESRLSSIKDKLQGVESENDELKVTKKELEDKTTLLDGALKKYVNSDLKISFHYPILFGEIKVVVKETEAGKKFLGTFSDNDQLLFGGVNNEYLAASSSMDNQFLNTFGFAEEDEGYYYKTIHGESNEYEIEPMRTVETRNGLAIMLNKDGFVVDGDTTEAWDFGLGQDIAAVINISHDDFSGIAFIDKNTARFPLSDFEEMLKTFEIK